MRTAIILILTALAIAGAAVLARSTYVEPTTTDIAVLADITETNTPPLISPEDVSSLYGTDMWNGRKFLYQNLSDVSIAKETGAYLPSANKWLSNELERKQSVQYFQKNLMQIFSDAGTVPQGKNESSLYVPIADELATLSASKAHRRILIIASDLMENTSSLSFYTPATLKFLQSDPSKIQAILERLRALPDLTGIEIYLLYYPKTPDRDGKYQIVSAFYKTVFEQKGATVSIGSLPHPEN